MNKNNERKEIEDLLRKGIEETKKIEDTVISMLKENIIQRRDLIKDLVIVSGAIASFSILGLNSPFIKRETFFILALVILLGIIGYSVYLLNWVLRKENAKLTKHREDNDKIMQAAKRIFQEKMSEGSIEDFVKIQNKLGEKYEPKIEGAKTQKSKKFNLELRMNILVSAFLISLLFIGLSFAPIENKIFTWILAR